MTNTPATTPSRLAQFVTFISTEVSKAEAAIGPDLKSLGTILVELEGQIEHAITVSVTADQAIAMVDPVLTVLLGSLTPFLGQPAVDVIIKFVVPGVNTFIRTNMPAAAVPAPTNQAS